MLKRLLAEIKWASVVQTVQGCNRPRHKLFERAPASPKNSAKGLFRHAETFAIAFVHFAVVVPDRGARFVDARIALAAVVAFLLVQRRIVVRHCRAHQVCARISHARGYFPAAPRYVRYAFNALSQVLLQYGCVEWNLDALRV